MDVTINNFKGSIPRVADHLIPAGSATLAMDCNLHSGRLSSWREPQRVQTSGAVISPQTKTAFPLNSCSCWISMTSCVDIAYGDANCTRAYCTGRSAWPEEILSQPTGCQAAFRRLGLPLPDSVPSVSVTSSPPSGQGFYTSMTVYAYQFVNGDGLASMLSPASNEVKSMEGVDISGWAIPSPMDGWGALKVRIYRLVVGDSYGREEAHTENSTWMAIGETSGGSFSYDPLTAPLPFSGLVEDIVAPPPDDLQGMEWIESMNCLAGFSGRNLYFSENNEYHNWPFKMTLDDTIRGITESNGFVYVATDGHPYVVSGEADCPNAGCRKAIRMPYSMPMIAHGNRHIASTASGAVYPSHKGLVLIHQTSQPIFLTWPLYSPEDWQNMQPWTAIPVQADGKLFCFTKTGGFAMNMPEGPEGGWGADGHTELSDTDVKDAWISRDGRFFLLKDSGVYEWNRGATLRPHKWVSHEQVQPVPYSFGAGHLFFTNGAEHVRIEVDQRVALDRDVLSDRVFRLPMWANGTRWQFTLSGTAEVSLLSVAATMQDLGR